MRTPHIAPRRTFPALICLVAATALAGCARPSMTAEQWQCEVIEAATPVLVEFYRPGCPSCTQLHPELDVLIAEYAGRVVFYRINTDVTWDRAEANGIHRVPTVLLFVEGKEVQRWVNEMKVDPYRAAIEGILR